MENDDYSTGGIISLIVLGLIGWWGYNQFLKPDVWSGFYQDVDGQSVKISDFSTRETCADWLDTVRPYRSNPECGVNCGESKTFPGVNVCEDTFD